MSMRTLGCVADQITERIVAQQAGRTDQMMADLLGCSRAYYAFMRQGKRRVSYPMAKRAAKVFPEVVALLIHDITTTAVG